MMKDNTTAVVAAERLAKLSLLSVEGIGNKTYCRLSAILEKLGKSWQEVWRSDELEKRREFYGLQERQAVSLKKFKKKWGREGEWWRESLAQKKIEVILSGDSEYPNLLRELEDGDRPEILFVKGEMKNLQNELKVAIVGTRRMTSYGQMAAKKIAVDLVRAEVIVVSGFMYGVDVTAQKAAFEEGGRTIGVLGYGFDFCFPTRQKKVMEEMIVQGQTFVSEYVPTTEPRVGNFPVRNRIVAGMSWGTVVVEAAEKSGSLITADLAAEYGREVFAVPAPIINPYGEGTKELLGLGATLVSSGGDILRELNGEWRKQQKTGGNSEDLTRPHIIERVLRERGGTIKIDELKQELNWSVEKLQTEILDLCLEDRIERQGECINLL